VADLAIAAVEILDVRSMQPIHEFAERLRAALKEQVHVYVELHITSDCSLNSTQRLLLPIVHELRLGS
jgi:hypothetical protein